MKKITLIFYVILLLFSCKHELERPTWDNTMIVPLVQTKMNVNNMLTDTNLNISENTEGFINLIYEESFIDMDLDTIVKIDAIADEQTHTLDSTSFKDVMISDTATIGETIQEIPLLAFLLPNGSTNSIPAVPNIASNDTINVDASEYFETMTLYKGMLIISLSNGYPTDIANVDIEKYGLLLKDFPISENENLDLKIPLDKDGNFIINYTDNQNLNNKFLVLNLFFFADVFKYKFVF